MKYILFYFSTWSVTKIKFIKFLKIKFFIVKPCQKFFERNVKFFRKSARDVKKFFHFDVKFLRNFSKMGVRNVKFLTKMSNFLCKNVKFFGILGPFYQLIRCRPLQIRFIYTLATLHISGYHRGYHR